MRRIIIAAFITLDGVMQAPGGPSEDSSGGFTYGGWTDPFGDDEIGAELGKTFAEPFDLLLGRRTYDIFAAHWPHIPDNHAHGGIARAFNAGTKHVATHRPESLAWENSVALHADTSSALKTLKAGEGPDLLVQGSSELVQMLVAEGLADELRLLIYPLLLGRGKRLFGSRAMPNSYRLLDCNVSSSGVVMVRYGHAADVATGSYELSPELR